MTIWEAVTPLFLLLAAGAAVLLLLRRRGGRHGEDGSLPNDPLADLFMDHDSEEE